MKIKKVRECSCNLRFPIHFINTCLYLLLLFLFVGWLVCWFCCCSLFVVFVLVLLLDMTFFLHFFVDLLLFACLSVFDFHWFHFVVVVVNVVVLFYVQGNKLCHPKTWNRTIN